jgi:putative sigma-54 modulation protein
MTRLNLHGRNIELTAGLKDALFDKMERVFSHFDFIQSIDVHLSVHKNPRISEPQIAEALIHVNRGLIKVEAHAEDMYAAVDILVDKMTRSLTKYKSKNLGRAKSARSHKGDSIRLYAENGVAVPMDEQLDLFDIDFDTENEAAAFAEAEVQAQKYA